MRADVMEEKPRDVGVNVKFRGNGLLVLDIGLVSAGSWSHKWFLDGSCDPVSRPGPGETIRWFLVTNHEIRIRASRTFVELKMLNLRH